MQELVKELIDILEKERQMYGDILKISRDKTSIIVEGKVSELEKITKLEQSFILQMAKLEDRRESIISALSKAMGEKPEDLNISKIIKSAGDECGEKLKAQQEKMLETINELKNLNDLNSKLIKNSLEYINFSINLLSSAGEEDNNYNVSAEKTSKKGRNFFDLKV